MKTLPIYILNLLKESNIQINTNFTFEVHEVPNHIPTQKMFYSYSYSNHRTHVFYYKIEVPNLFGHILIEENGDKIRIVRNSLTEELDLELT